MDIETRMRPREEILHQGLSDLPLGEEHPQDFVSEEFGQQVTFTREGSW
jgi:hypothetical protein